MPLVGNRMDIWPSRLLLQRSVDPGFEEGMEVRLESWIKLALQGDLEIKIGIVYIDTVGWTSPRASNPLSRGNSQKIYRQQEISDGSDSSMSCLY